jgi:LPPG:FO 2-phospho-L-lactate transferase
MDAKTRVVALSGGIGGAKLVLGLSRVIAPGDLMVIANTGDDFEHLGFWISPDLDTLMYTLAGLADPDRGWGRRDETWTFLKAQDQLGGETWFRLGDGDLATHLQRSEKLKAGVPLSRITAEFCRRLGIASRICPMSDDRVQTRVRTPDGWLSFQDYFVRNRCEPSIVELIYDGVEKARALPEILQALNDPDLRAVVICPSNPYLSIDPILNVPGICEALADCSAPVIAISPIIAGQAVKGPTAKIMRELGVEPTALSIAKHYGELLDGFIVDQTDAACCRDLDIPVIATQTLMLTLADREALARTVLESADTLAKRVHVAEQ